MSLDAQLIPDNLTDSDSDCIDVGTGRNHLFFVFLSFSVFTLLDTSLNIFSSNLACSFVRTRALDDPQKKDLDLDPDPNL